MSVMLFKGPGPHLLHGHALDYVIVEEDEVSAALAAGWFLTTAEAAEAPKSEFERENQELVDNAPPTKAELIQHAQSLGIDVDGRWSVKRLEDEIKKASK